MDFMKRTLNGLLSKVTGGKTLIDSYMLNDLSILIEKLESYGISENDISQLFSEIESIRTNKEAFSNAQNMIADMYEKKLSTMLSNGEAKEEDLKDSINDFDSLVVHKGSELISLTNSKEAWNTKINYSKDHFLNVVNRISAKENDGIKLVA